MSFRGGLAGFAEFVVLKRRLKKQEHGYRVRIPESFVGQVFSGVGPVLRAIGVDGLGHRPVVFRPPEVAVGV